MKTAPFDRLLAKIELSWPLQATTQSIKVLS
jgi:hypothetical protein